MFFYVVFVEKSKVDKDQELIQSDLRTHYICLSPYVNLLLVQLSLDLLYMLTTEKKVNYIHKQI